ncbi:MAG: hypothetical protein U0165_02705 [Polyangiaceae bacterium]
MTPPDAKILPYNFSLSFRIERDVFKDYPGHQGLVSGRCDRADAELARTTKSLGLPTCSTISPRAPYQAGRDHVCRAVSATGSRRHAASATTTLHVLSAKVPWAPASSPIQSARRGRDQRYQPGLYLIQSLNTVEQRPDEKKVFSKPERALPKEAASQSELVEQADAVMFQG